MLCLYMHLLRFAASLIDLFLSIFSAFELLRNQGSRADYILTKQVQL